MFAARVPLLLAFAGGCLSSAVVLGVWLGREGETEPVTPVKAVSNAQERVAEPTRPEREAEPRAAKEADEHEAPNHEAPDHEAPEPGASVADVLARLEREYRRELAAAPAAVETREEAEPRPAEPQPVEAVVAQPAQPAAAQPGTAQPLAAAPLPAAPPASPNLPAPEPVRAPAPAEAQPVAVNIAQQNTHIGNVHQGDAFHVQQVEIIQPVPALVPFYAVPPALPNAKGPQRVMNRRPNTSPTALTNPDNPWGFDFPPRALVK